MRNSAKVWWSLSLEDIDVARELHEIGRFSNAVIFHSQQAAEKGLKACFEEKELDIPKIHSCKKLISILYKAKVILSYDDDDLDQLDEVYIDTRYPSNLGELPKGKPTQSDAAHFLLISERILKGVETFLFEC